MYVSALQTEQNRRFSYEEVGDVKKILHDRREQ